MLLYYKINVSMQVIFMYNSNFRLSPSAIFCLHIFFMCHKPKKIVYYFPMTSITIIINLGVNTTDFYSLTVPDARSLKAVSLGPNRN